MVGLRAGVAGRSGAVRPLGRRSALLDDDHTDGSAATYTRRGVLHRGAIAAAAMAGASGLALPQLAGAAPAAPVKGGKLIVGIGQVFEDINVITAFGYRWGQLMAYAMYDTLVKFDSKGKAIP